MTEGNGGEMKVGERLRRIEDSLETIKNHLEDRITRHKEANEAHLKELATTVVTDFGKRVSNLEKESAADAAVKSYRKWVIGGTISLATLLLGVMAMLLQVLSKVNG